MSESESLKVREVFGKPIKAGLSAGLTDRSKSENDAGGKMTPEKAVEQLQTLIEDAESHREPDGSLDKIYQDDIAALHFAIEAIKAFDEMDESLTAILKECVSG